MSKLVASELTVPCCLLPRNNPFPIMNPPKAYNFYDVWKKRLSPEMGKYTGFGARNNFLPYCRQDGFDAKLLPRKLRTYVLESDRMKAIFLPDFGGRLYSLYDKKLKRELFYRNPVMKLGNLSIRGTWFSGGVEFNCGMYGHTALGTEPMFFAELKLPNGMPVLRMYEYERVLNVVYQVDVFFPEEGSSFLCTRPRIVNTNDHTIPLYWWTNMAIPETPDTRVLVSSEKMLITSEETAEQPFPVMNDVDHSYSRNINNAVDLFFVIPKSKNRSWEAAVDGDGWGTVATGSALLEGRKLFVWGNNPGSDRRQEMLTGKERGHYIEIQTGLGRTQMEARPLDAHTETGWLEVFSLVHLDRDIAHGNNYKKTLSYVHNYLEEILPEKDMNEIEKIAAKVALSKPDKILSTGSGWGALELKRLQATGGRLPDWSTTPFPESTLGEYQKPFIDLLSGKAPADKYICISAWEVTPEWQKLIKKVKCAWSYYQQAIALFADNKTAEAYNMAKKANRACTNSKAKIFTTRLEARLASLNGKKSLARRKYKEILTFDSDFQLWLEGLELFLDVSRTELKKFSEAFDNATIPARFSGRRKLNQIKIAIRLNDLERAGELFSRKFEVADLWEHEQSLEEDYIEYRTRLLARAMKVKWDRDFNRAHKSEIKLPKWLNISQWVNPNAPKTTMPKSSTPKTK